MRILFMGTPDFAKICLEAICKTDNQVVGVVTTEDKPRGRGMVLTPTPVKAYALEAGLPVYQPKTLKDGAFSDVLRALEPELIVVVAYGKILPKYVLDFPKFGCINAHASILPKYRGAAPIQRAIIDGESKTGVSIMQMDIGLDTGDVILVEETDILEEDNFETVHDKLALCGSVGLVKTIELFKSGKITHTAQGEDFTYAEKITKDDCVIDFSKDSVAVHNQIRGLSPVPVAFTKTPDGKILKVTKAHRVDTELDGQIGQVLSLDGGIIVKCKKGAIALDTVIPEGKGKMDAQAYINGRKIKVGDILG
ncbi:MAG: methionyl-tRNA formyltransferase [Clostridia bacterium]|nr:methionyl-tRNA formyltransferase [Clostridia bacterium]